MEPKPEKQKRVIQKEIEIAAPADAVWKALTPGSELTNWFPLEAEVVPGPQGKIRVSWGRSGMPPREFMFGSPRNGSVGSKPIPLAAK